MTNAAALIGPNAILRVAEALPERIGIAATRRLFERAALARHLDQPPQGMVPEQDVQQLHAALRVELGDSLARDIARDAGRRTAVYLLAYRIPRPVQCLLRHLPARAAAVVLLSAIRRHAWTFAGSGQFEARGSRPARLTLRNNPLCRGVRTVVPTCDYYAATFEHLFASLVHRNARVHELTCEAAGGDACRFEVRW